MAFQSFSELLIMGGHGIYVWTAFIITITLLKLIFVKPFFEKKKILNEIRQQIVRERAIHSNTTKVI